MSEGFNTTQLTDTIWAIDEGMVSCFLIVGSRGALLIDCCMSTGDGLAEIVAGITDKPVSLVFTHSDQDHTGGQASFGTPLLHTSEFAQYFSKDNAGKAVKPLWEGDIIELGDKSLEVVLIPGHTPGSIALLNRSEGRIFTGDTISDSWIYLFGPGRNLMAFIASLKKLERMTGVFDTVHASHGSPVLGNEWIAKTLEAAEKLLAGELEAADPPYEMPCKSYSYNGVTMLY